MRCKSSQRAAIARWFVFLLALWVVIGSSCTPRLQQQTTLRIWQTAVDPKAVAVLKEIGAELERTHPGVRVEIESVAWGDLSSKLTAAIGAGDPPDIAHLEPFMFSSMQSKNLLEPLDDVISSLNPDDIYPAVKDLQLFEGASLRNRSRVRYHLLRVSQRYRGSEGFKGAANLGGIREVYQEYGVGGRQQW